LDPITLAMIHNEILGSLAWFKPPAQFIFLALVYVKRLCALNLISVIREATPDIFIKIISRTFFVSLRLAFKWLADRSPKMFIYCIAFSSPGKNGAFGSRT
ncbi:hypothetical protein MPER_05845, partial [Moniliophthora perniciosa FA553]